MKKGLFSVHWESCAGCLYIDHDNETCPLLNDRIIEDPFGEIPEDCPCEDVEGPECGN